MLQQDLEAVTPPSMVDNSKAMGLVMLRTVVCVSFALVISVAIWLSLKKISPEDSDESRLKIREISEMFRRNMNRSQDPCDDFYEFACGNFKSTRKIPDQRAEVSSATEVTDEIRELLRAQLSLAYTGTVLGPLKFARKLYQKCIKQDPPESDNLHRLRGLIDSFTGRTLEEQIILAILSHLPSVMAYKFMVNHEKTRKNLVILPDIDSPELISAIAHSPSLRKVYTDCVATGLKIYNPSREAHEIETEATLVVNFERDLADLKDPCSAFQGSLQNLSRLVPNINFSKIFEGLSGRRIEYVDLICPESFLRIDTLLKNSTGILAKYHSWKAIKTYGALFSEQFAHEKAKVEKALHGTLRANSRDDICLNLMIGMLPHVTSRLIVDAIPSVREDVKGAREIVTEVRKSMEAIIREKNWIDDASRERAINKLNSMKILIGFPRWIENDDLLIESFPHELMSDESTFDAIIKLSAYMTREEFSIIDKPYNSELEWHRSAASSVAQNDVNANIVLLGPIVLRGAYYGRGRPEHCNYGAFGSVAGHEITHAFDREGSQFPPPDGLWTNSTKKTFNELIGQMMDMYDNITGNPWSGYRSLGENIADFGGVRAAYRASFGEKRKNQSLPGLEMYTSQQIFFISWANAWCGLDRLEHRMLKMEFDSHPPREYRVNLPLANFEEFAEAFRCGNNTKMNPMRKIRVW